MITGTEIIVATVAAIVVTATVYAHSGFKNIRNCYSLWLRRDYWNSYNIIEAVSWLAKATVIVPGLIFQIHIWQLYWITLMTSAMLIWVSNHKLLPTLVGFNTLWIWLSFCVIVYNL